MSNDGSACSELVPSYDDDAFILTERVPHIVIESSQQDHVARIYEGFAPTGGGRTVVEVATPE